MKRYLLPLLSCFLLAPLAAQVTGGRYVFQSLLLSPSARITGLGGYQIAVRDDDPNFALQNPGALNAGMNGRLSFNHNFFLSDIQHGQVVYAHALPKSRFTLMGGLQYLDYGKIQRADEYGNKIGEVPASESIFSVGAARSLTDKLSLGLRLQAGFSTLDVFKSSVLNADAGFVYADTSRRFTAGLVLRNAGVQLNTYDQSREDLPFDLQFGITKRLRHLPFRFGIVAHHLHTWNIRYSDPNLKDDDILLFGDEAPKENKFGNAVDNLFRHLVFNGEFLFGKYEGFKLRFGYNHLRKRELSVNNYRSLAGFSGGLGIKIKRFRLDAGFGAYHLAGGVFHLGLGTNLRDFF